MILAQMRWPEIESLDRECTVLIPTGSIEQHGAHLPLDTDSRLVTAVAQAVEARLPDQVLLTPTLWLGASLHHLAFPGSLSASFAGYEASLKAVIESLTPHGFRRFYVLNGHGGNASINDITLRNLKAAHPNLVLGAGNYYAFGEAAMAEALTGPLKSIRHADEAETSLMLHVAPDLVRLDLAQNDGLACEPPVRGAVEPFEVITDRGAFGYPSFATSEKGAKIFAACVEGVAVEIEAFRTYVLRGLPAG